MGHDNKKGGVGPSRLRGAEVLGEWFAPSGLEYKNLTAEKAA